MPPARLSTERLAEIACRRALQYVPLDDWGPVCAGCGAAEYRLDGFCSMRCRDFHCDEDVPELLAHVAALESELAPLREIARAAKRERICDSYDRCPNDPQCGEALDALLAAWREPDGGESR